ncbi:4-alpha-L-fucosyltransferase glycosyl transferase group 56 [Dethiosulfatibacter aminovorans DSM 17477]|uniref:4-alpha-L-fucosyltransferase glycosyl transferase group 56 n=1 Tax=Dethiosulfatibacter aminovorans DSM 17477 TaxID=1121476 RepID=A0A1M6LM82_9FIRM|nr:TDP-N-acetylfucosamine:lipid II N-acetylfucosaminyltransferase [Dethiosulfatibacter aminovorans]SHJ72351.1 4-alpha-L-fucosyltransferase glycosyl transferase group 56 [Dethiosulfatibacter aminovorans DSM 17477]
MRYLHVCSNEKFIPDYIDFINRNFDSDEHKFLVIKSSKYEIEKNEQVVVIDNVKDSIRLLNKHMKESKKIIFHSLINTHLIYFLFIHKSFLRKTYWVVWGADLYTYQNKSRNFKEYLKHSLRKFVYSRIHGIVTHIYGDYELAKKWYGVKGEYFYSFMYPSNLYKEYSLEPKKEEETTFIQVGNSADPSNNHLEIFEKLSGYKNENIKIFCPLSYGNSKYRDEIIKSGKEIFHDKFEPFIDFLPFEEYLDILGRTDIAIFNHKRQQAMGNITTLLGLGKKVYIRDDITTWGVYIKYGIKLYETNSSLNNLFEKMDKKIICENIKKIKEIFSEEKLIDDLDSIFKS